MKKLPIAGTSAAVTAFCSARIDGPGGTYLYVDGNGKITRDNGTLDEPKPNAFSLRAQAVTDAAHALETNHFNFGPKLDCPGSTDACRSSCYVGGLEKHARATYDLYEHNSVEIRRILADPKLADDWAMEMAEWIRWSVTSFRWHVSGDVFSPEYARWIADVCRESPKVEHWIYTRSFDEEILRPLVEVSTLLGGNLALNLSADRDNFEAAIEAAEKWGGHAQPLRVCYLTLDGTVPRGEKGETLLYEGDVIFPDYSIRGGTPEGQEWFANLSRDEKPLVCPVDFHGKAENRRCGPCSRCLT